MASLFKKNTGFYYLAFTDRTRQPSQKQIALKTNNKRQAERLKAQYEDDYERGLFDPWDSTGVLRKVDLRSLSNAIDAFIVSRANLSTFTIKKYESVLGLLRDHLGGSFPVLKITTSHVQQFLDSSKKKAITKKTYSTTLSPFFKWLVEHKEIKRNPVEGIRLERAANKYPKYLLPQHVEAICDKIRARQKEAHVNGGTGEWLIPIVRANVILGLRAGELVNLKWEHIDFDRKTLKVACTDTFRTKSGKERMLPLNRNVTEILQGLERRSEYVFTSHAGRKLSRLYLSRAFKHYAEKAEIENVNFHATRHTAASWLAQASCSVEAIRTYMGHSSITVTQRYMHHSPATFYTLVNEAFDRVYNAKSTAREC